MIARALTLAMWVGCAAAAAEDWTLIAASAAGSDWHLRRGSIAVSAGSVDGEVRHTNSAGQTRSFRAAVPERYCGAPRGDLTLRDTSTGEVYSATVWQLDDGRVATTIATALCRAAGKLK